MDYSKWDKLELSDDEGYECHPNVDKASMTRWKQAQIHKERQERQDQHDLLDLEFKTNTKFISEISPLFSDLDSDPLKVCEFLMELGPRVDKTYTDPMRSLSMERINKWPQNWDPPVWGDVLRTHVPWHEQIGEILINVTRYTAEHRDLPGFNPSSVVKADFKKAVEKLEQRQLLISQEIKLMDEKKNAKITMENLKTGFNKTNIAPKAVIAPAADAQGASTGNSSTVETIHSPATSSQIYPELFEEISNELQSSDEHMIAVHPKLVLFSKMSDFGQLLQTLRKDMGLLEEKCEEALLIRALTMEIVIRTKESKNCVMLSLLLKYTRTLGPSGIDIFFGKYYFLTRLQSGSSNAYTMFFQDLEKTHDHIKKRATILRMEHVKAHKEHLKGVAQHQANLQSVYNSFLQPDGTLSVPVEVNPTQKQIERSEWFNALPFYFQEGLLLEDIDKINQYLSGLSPEMAEKEAQLAIDAGFIHIQEEEEDEE